ncbi:MAG: FapA family protein [Clostridia bacterium]|nr:FapA family protein [Clostridia bacterium]
MDNSTIFSNEYLRFISYHDGVYIETYKNGFPFEQMNSILSAHPEIEITSFNVLKNSLNNAPRPPEKIGRLKERIIIQTLDRDLKATIVYNLPKEELSAANREKLVIETMAKLKEKGIVFGIKKDFFAGEICSGVSYVIAEGAMPINGKDSVIKMYQIQEAKPEVEEDGTVNFYEIKLINRVKEGDWLGERIDATLGTPGQSVKGQPIKAGDGKTIALLYDRNTVVETPESQKTVLYSKINGAVSYVDGKVTVSNHLEIEGDVDFRTGNIDFDGYLTINGTVIDGFQVTATNDIEINGNMGISNVKGITSKNGSIFIKGGISSKGKVEIKAAKNLYTKFVDNATIKCGEAVYISSHCINSSIEAKEVIIDSSKGSIVGGNIKAQIKVVAPVIGSELEKKTVIEVAGFDRAALTAELADIIEKINYSKAEQQRVKSIMLRLEARDKLNPIQQKEYNNNFQRLLALREEVKELEVKKKNISHYLLTKGEGEVCATKKIYPNCVIVIKKNRIEITSLTLATSIYWHEEEIKYT